VSDDEITSLLTGLRRRAGIERLARQLGFTGELSARRTTRGPCEGKRVLSVRRGTLKLHVLRTRAGAGPGCGRAALRGCAAAEPAAHHVVVIVEPSARRVIIACDVLGDGMRHIVLEPASLRPVDCDIVRDILGSATGQGTAAALRVMNALDRRALTARFFRDVRGVRDLISQSWTGLPPDATGERDGLALILISRLLFLYFLQRRRLLAGDERFLPALLAQWQRRPARGSFFRGVLRVLFFGVLNRRVERRTHRARSFGDLPYLNGGLFEQHVLEQRRPKLDLPDTAVDVLFSALLEKYRFAGPDADAVGAGDVGDGIDPELLGQIFEGLMPRDKRAVTGTFYTPSAAVDRLVVHCLAQHVAAETGIGEGAIAQCLRGEPHDLAAHELCRLRHACERLRVIDPACGSGTFLLGALLRLTRMLDTCTPTRAGDGHAHRIRREVVARSLHGVDLLHDAALICSLRLWLALVPACGRVADVPPLPNLDHRIRQGDALVDPIESQAALLAGTGGGTRKLRTIMRQIEPVASQYLTADPEARAVLRRRIVRLERGLATAWLDSLVMRLGQVVTELTARAQDRDLFGDATPAAVAARNRLPALQRHARTIATLRGSVSDERSLPFFSFRVHFASAADGFDVVLSNPPWVRSHAWPAATASLLRDRYVVCERAGWPYAATLTGTPAGAGAQVDLAFLFLERSIQLLRDGGTLGMVLPAKLLRSLAPGGARALLLRDAAVTTIEDHSLDQGAVFDADAFTAVITARKSAGSAADVFIRMTRGCGDPLEFVTDRPSLPLRRDDERSPWLLAPPACAAALRTMQAHGTEIGRLMSVRRGAMTGANDLMIVASAELKLGGLALVTSVSDGRTRRALVEDSTIRPVLRGSDVRPWRATHSSYVLWSPANDDDDAAVPRRLAALLRRRRSAALASGGTARTAHDGRLRRLSTGMFGHKVVWSDLARDLRAAAVPDRVRACGASRPVVPLNTVYFIPVADRRESLLLSAYLNALPLRTFARAIAERAKDAHFRFFAWTIATLPLPRDWRTNEHAEALVELADSGHAAGSLTDSETGQLDDRVAHCFCLTPAGMSRLAAFDRWLRAEDT
jgi:hypothetical protein